MRRVRLPRDEPRMNVQSARRKYAELMTEKELESSVAALCTFYRLARFHQLNSIGTAPGWPDDTILGPKRAIFRELKTQKGRLTTAQTATHDIMVECGLDIAVWRPIDLIEGRIENELKDLAGIRKPAKRVVDVTCPHCTHPWAHHDASSNYCVCISCELGYPCHDFRGPS